MAWIYVVDRRHCPVHGMDQNRNAESRTEDMYTKDNVKVGEQCMCGEVGKSGVAALFHARDARRTCRAPCHAVACPSALM